MENVALPAKWERQSGVELIKILSIVLIVLNHVTQTLQADNPYISYQDYLIGFPSGAVADFLPLLLVIFRYSGVLGNGIFFLCSAWFFLDKLKGNPQKITRIFSDVWAISVLTLAVFAVCMRGNLDRGLVIRQFFPVVLNNNWYATNYLLFCPLYPACNQIIRRLSKQGLFRAACFLAFLYIFVPVPLMMWITLYFIMAYIKFHMAYFCRDRKQNFILLTACALGMPLSSILLNKIGLHWSRFSFAPMLLVKSRNPLVFLCAVALINLALQSSWKNRIVNYISRMSLLIYLIHENLLVRTYLRPWIWQKIYIGGGYNHIILWIFTYSAVLFLLSFAASVFYVTVIQKTVWRVSGALFKRVFRLWEKLETRFLSLR